jgi:PAS domain S-box-containing protein
MDDINKMSENELRKKILELQSKLGQVDEQEFHEGVNMSEVYELIVRSTDDLIAITSFALKPKYVYVSPSHERLLGYKSEDLLGTNGFDYVHPDDQSKLRVLIKKYLEAGWNKIRGRKAEIVERFDYRIRNKKGEWIDVESIAKLIPGGKILFYSRNISKQKEAKKALEKAREQWELIFKNIAHPAMLLDATFTILDVNDATIKLAGKTAEELLGQKCHWIFHNCKKPLAVESGCPMSKLLSDIHNGPVEMEMEALGRIFLVSCTPIWDDKGALEKIIHIATDVTEIKEYEQKLLENERNYKRLIDQFPDAIIIHKNDQIIYVNAKVMELVGAKKEDDLLGRNVRDFVLSENHQKGKQRLNKLLQGESEYPVVDKYKRLDGSVMDVSVWVTAIQFDNGAAFQVVIRDISEESKARKELEKYKLSLEEKVSLRTEELEKQATRLADSQRALTFLLEDSNEIRKELEQSNKMLKSLNSELESFSYSVSHDLRAPLTRMDGFSKALMEDYSEVLDETGQHFLRRIRVSSQHMASLIDDLLNLSRITRQQVIKTDVDLTSLTKLIVKEIKELNPAYTVQFQVAEGMHLFADRRLLKVMLTNLIGNAAKFSSKKEKPVVEIGELKTDHKTEFFIKDNGVGFEMKYSEQIFNPFNRLHTDKEYEGSGVGLAIVKRVINKHDGEIRVESREGKETTFYFKI